MSAPDEASPVCVLGMMRTGTSLVAGVLHLLGVHFGPSDSLLQANRANPTGFMEHRGIIALNDELLARLGGTWFAPPNMSPGWECGPAHEDLRTRAAELVSSELGGAPRWGWKDPRTCLTLPFWQSLHPSLAFVVCLRNPIASARSLAAMPWAQERLDSPFEQGLELWLRYTESALEKTCSKGRLVVLYDDVIADCHSEAARLAGFLGLGDALASPGMLEAINDFIEPSLRHQRSPAEPSEDAGRPELNALQRYSELLAVARDE